MIWVNRSRGSIIFISIMPTRVSLCGIFSLPKSLCLLNPYNERSTVFPILRAMVETLIKRLGADGYTLSDPEMSIEALAEQHNAETDAVLHSVFRE